MKALTDLEICTEIAKIEGVFHHISECKKHVMTEDLSTRRFGGIRFIEYSPLTDDALCFRLMVKHKVHIGHYHKGEIESFIGSCMEISAGSTVNHAVCMAIIDASNNE